MAERRWRAKAFAKINLGLKIAGRRADGYHELRTVFQTIALADEVAMSVGPGRGVGLEVTGLAAPGGRENLAYRAAERAAEAFGVQGRIELRLRKRIPAEAGLGGGSSDAAAVLRMAALAARRRPDAAAVLRLAQELGADVPAFLVGGTVLGVGRGDEVYPLPELGRWHCVVAMPRAGVGQAIATPEAFARWDLADRRRGGLTAADGSATLVEFCSLVCQVLPAFRLERNRGLRPETAASPRVHAGIENDFQSGVFSLSLDFPRIHQQLCRAGARWASLSGSGAAQFGLFPQAGPAQAAARRLERQYRCWRTRFVSRRECEAAVSAVR